MENDLYDQFIVEPDFLACSLIDCISASYLTKDQGVWDCNAVKNYPVRIRSRIDLCYQCRNCL